MGIALLALTGLFKNLSTPSTTTQILPKRHLGRIHPVWAARHSLCAPPAQALTKAASRAPGLRVLRIQESGQSAPSAGRMVISGRMADVCAELDRLVALEAQHSPN